MSFYIFYSTLSFCFQLLTFHNTYQVIEYFVCIKYMFFFFF
jgi:hypothetical protein